MSQEAERPWEWGLLIMQATCHRGKTRPLQDWNEQTSKEVRGEGGTQGESENKSNWPSSLSWVVVRKSHLLDGKDHLDHCSKTLGNTISWQLGFWQVIPTQSLLWMREKLEEVPQNIFEIIHYPCSSFCSSVIVKIACDLLDRLFIAVAPVALDADPCSRHLIMSSPHFTITSCKPAI